MQIRKILTIGLIGCLLAVLVSLSSFIPSAETACSYASPGKKHLYWGDLHVHTSYSLDAYSYGTFSTPVEAYAFARGDESKLNNGAHIRIDRPLDFIAITDHAEWYDFLYLCSDPEKGDHESCRHLRNKASPEGGGELFGDYVVPSIARDQPEMLDICKADTATCKSASIAQWQRVQEEANTANDSCKFTAFIGYEWSATPGFSHTHRNVIFRSDQVPKQAFDYIRYPDLQELFRQLDASCKPSEGCDVITIPHNTNLGDGVSFDVEQETDRELALRARYERLIEIHQEKGNSECLAPLGVTDESDCNFEVRLTKNTRPTPKDGFNSQEWERMRASYVRGLLLKGLAAYRRSGDKERNPLQLGIIGSTDNHAATPGLVKESDWQGSVFGIGATATARSMSRPDWNPGGLVAVWAEENTRDSLFNAMKRREVYGTSGPRIRLKFGASLNPLTCNNSDSKPDIPMGGEFQAGYPFFQISVLQDEAPIDRIEVIKGSLVDGVFTEAIDVLWQGDGQHLCLDWQDDQLDSKSPAFWYVRVTEKPTLRWSAHLCRSAGQCDAFPGADVMTTERAWSSPIWYLPEY